MTLVEQLESRLPEDQREHFRNLVAENPDMSVYHLFRQTQRKFLGLEE